MTAKEAGADLKELISRLKAVMNGATSPPAHEDPTANVSRLVELGLKHQDELRVADVRRLDDLRANDNVWRDKIDLKEERRLDANRAQDAASTALALERAGVAAVALQTQVATSAEALRASATVVKDTQDKRIGELEQSRWNIGGRETQRTEQRVEGRQERQFDSKQAVSIGAIVVGGCLTMLGLILTAAALGVAIFKATGH